MGDGEKESRQLHDKSRGGQKKSVPAEKKKKNEMGEVDSKTKMKERREGMQDILPPKKRLEKKGVNGQEGICLKEKKKKPFLKSP